MPLTRGRRVALAIGLPFALALVGWTAFSAVADADLVGFRVHLNVPARDGQTRVTIDTADATVRSGAGRRIWLNGNLLGSLAQPSFGWRSTGTGLTLHSRCWAPTGRCELGYAITAPAGLPLTVSDGSGNMNVSGFRGHVTLSDISGNLQASRLAGSLTLSDGSGDITASGLSAGGVRLSDGSGNVTVSGLSAARAGLNDGSGDIAVTGLAAAQVTSNDGSGNITLTFTKVPRSVTITADSGNITLVLPRGRTVYQVDAHSSTGTTNVTVRQVPTGKFSPYVIDVSSSSGDITIR